MLKKSLWIGLVLAGVLVLAVTGVTLAQGAQPPADADSCTCNCNFFFGGRGGRGGIKGFGLGDGSLISATAQVTGLTEDKVRTALQEGQTLAQIAEEAGKKATDVVEAFVAARKTELDAAVEAGKLTQKQADLMLELARENATQQLDKVWSAGRGAQPGGPLVTTTAEVTGLSEEQVVTALKEGKTFAEIAEGAGKKASDIVEALVAERKADLDEAVKAGKLTQKQADLMVELMRETLTQQVAKTWTAGSGTMMRGGGLMGGGMLRGGGKFHGGGWQTQP